MHAQNVKAEHLKENFAKKKKKKKVELLQTFYVYTVFFATTLGKSKSIIIP